MILIKKRFMNIFNLLANKDYIKYSVFNKKKSLKYAL